MLEAGQQSSAATDRVGAQDRCPGDSRCPGDARCPGGDGATREHGLLACGQSRPPFPVLSSVTGQAVEKVLLKHVPSVHGRTINEADAGSLPFDSFNERLLTSKY